MFPIAEIMQCRVEDLGLVKYPDAYQKQKTAVEEVLSGSDQKLFICEHPSVLTLGRLSKIENILAGPEFLKERNIEVVKIDRGGDVTLHAPGQLVAYPILDLHHFGCDLRFYMHQLEQVAIDLLIKFGILAGRIDGKTGVWVAEKKVASLGIGVRRWVSYHGLAINVSTDLKLFEMIRPCGLDAQMVSIEELLKGQKQMKDVKKSFIECFQKVFHLNIY